MSWLEAQKDLNDFLSRNAQRIADYKFEMEQMVRMADQHDDELKFKTAVRQDITDKYRPLLEEQAILTDAYEQAYHDQVHSSKGRGPITTEQNHFGAQIDLTHPDNPSGERQSESWKPNSAQSRAWRPSGGTETSKLILLPQ